MSGCSLPFMPPSGLITSPIQGLKHCNATQRCHLLMMAERSPVPGNEAQCQLALAQCWCFYLFKCCTSPLWHIHYIQLQLYACISSAMEVRIGLISNIYAINSSILDHIIVNLVHYIMKNITASKTYSIKLNVTWESAHLINLTECKCPGFSTYKQNPAFLIIVKITNQQ